MSSPEGWEGLTQAVSEAPRADDMDILYGKVFKSSDGSIDQTILRNLGEALPPFMEPIDTMFVSADTLGILLGALLGSLTPLR